MSAPGSASDVDQRSVRAAALRTAWQIVAVAGGVVALLFALAVAFVLDQSRPTELLERPAPGESKIYVDANEVLIALVLLGIVAVVVLGVASWRISRRAVAPLGSALRIQRAFVADASHELRTPLTVLDTRLQVLERKLDRGESHGETLAAARRDTRIMIDLVTDLLLVAEASAGAGAAPAECDLRPVVTGSVGDLRLLAAERDIELDLVVVNEARIAISGVGLRRAVVVLIDNAIAHSPDGGVVGITAETDRGRAVIRVRDEGAGITGIDPEHVFERFAHGTSTGRRRGFGIGLALVRDLAVRHGGRVLVESTGPHGTVMRLELPVSKA